MQITVGVGDDDIQLCAIGEKVGGDGFDVVWGFAKEAELVGVLLYQTGLCVSVTFFYLSR